MTVKLHFVAMAILIIFKKNIFSKINHPRPFYVMKAVFIRFMQYKVSRDSLQPVADPRFVEKGGR